MKILKRLFIALAILGVLFVAAGFAASQYINKELVEKQVSEATGREFKIEGELSPVISLTPSVRAEKVSMSNAAWGSQPKLASIGSFEVKVQLLPLLSKKIVIDKIVIDNADILLEKKGDKWNFDFEKTAEKSENEKEKPVAEKKPLSFDISGLEITNSHLVVRQDGKPMDVNVKALKFAPRKDKMGLDFEGMVDKRPLKISADLPPMADLMGGKAVDVASLVLESGDIKLNANATVNMGTKQAEIKNLDIQKADIKISAKGVGNIDTKIINLSSVSFVKGNLKFNGSVSVDASGKKPHIRGSLVGDSVVLPAKAGAKSGDASSSKGGAMFSDEPLPFDAFDLVNADLGLKIGHLKSGNIVLDNINATVKLSNGVLALIPLNAAFAGGQISSNITLSKASTRINLKGANLSMEKILAQIAGFDDFKNGVTNADIALSGSGDSLAKIAGSLSGSTHVSMGAATYSGEILKGRAAQFSQLLYGDSGSRTLVINCVLTDINWVNGAGTFQKLGVDTKYANINGSGNIRLASETLNLVLTPVSKLPKLNNLAIPIGVSGTFGNPQISEKKIIENVAQTVGQNVLKDFLAAKQSGDKFKFNLKKAAGIDKNATIASPCGAAPVTVPAAAEKAVPTTEVAPAAEAAPQVQQQPAPTMEPERPLTKKEKKAQKINDALKQFGF